MLDTFEKLDRVDHITGWYHSHPGYKCWLSGIDVATQIMMQKIGPTVAIVVDPLTTSATGRVEIGAFRTLPETYKETSNLDASSVPLEKIKEFGAHFNRYYPLAITYFKNSLDEEILDVLTDSLWIPTISRNILSTSADYFDKNLSDVTMRVKQSLKTSTLLDVGPVKTRSQEQKNMARHMLERNQAMLGNTVSKLLFK